MDWLFLNIEVVVDIVTKVIAVAAAVAAVVPSGGEAGKVIASIRKAIDLLALNVGNAKNAE